MNRTEKMENTPYVRTMEELEALIASWGFLPFFRNRIEGFSIFDVMDRERIFSNDGDCAWLWKGPVLSHLECAYGRFFSGKAGFVHLRWLPDLMNFRRCKHPMESYSQEACRILETLRGHECMLSTELKLATGFTLSRKRVPAADPGDPSRIVRKRNTGLDFDALIRRLQAGTYVCIADFEPAAGRSALSGWASALYSTPEAMYHLDWRALTEGRTPAQSRQLILYHLKGLFPEAAEKDLKALI